MAFNNFQTGILLRLAGLQATLALLAWMVTRTNWYVTMTICAATVVLQMVGLGRYSARAGREVGRFLDAIAFDDPSAGFAGLSRDKDFSELGHAMTRVLEQLRSGRADREEQAQYLQSLLAHMPVALISVNAHGTVQLLNLAARRLFAGPCDSTDGFARYGAPFAMGLEALKPGQTTIVRMERGPGALQLKAAATDVVVRGTRRRLISLQNIESELTAQELVAWQTVIRVMAHEVMNSLTPISSLAGTARDRVEESLSLLPQDHAARSGLDDAAEALDTLARRSDGLLHFVQNHRRLTKRMVAQTSIMPMRRVFTRLQRLLADECKTRDIALTARVEPETLEIAADADLIDQALINLVRNAMDALRDTVSGRITLSAVFALLDKAANPDAVLASSTSAILPSQFTAELDGRARCVVVHPLNPPYLIPAAEIVPAPWTDADVVTRTADFLRSAGHAPIVMQRELEGFVMNRLQGALLEEAFRLVAEGYASVEDIDVGLREGLALRWSFMGPFETIDLNAPGGVRDYVERYEQVYQRIATSALAHPQWSGPVLDTIETERRKALAADQLQARQAWRDRRLIALAAFKQHAAKIIPD